MKEFKYDVIHLIEGVRDRSCLWDRTLENYKDRVERRTAWEEIFSALEDRYDEMTPEEKRITEEHIQNKWTNIRDTFVKTLKTKIGKPKRKYQLYDHLKFLTKIIQEEGIEYIEDTSPPISTYMKEENVEREKPAKKRTKRDVNDDDYIPKKSKDKKKASKNKIQYEEDVFTNISKDDSSDLDFCEVESEDPRIMNEDEAFFASLLPTVVKYDEDERLEFRIEVLSVMKKIKDNRKFSRNCVMQD